MSKTYKSSHYEKIRAIEKKHFWFRIRSMLLKQVIHSYVPSPRDMSFLEVGFGTGIVLQVLNAMGFKTTGIDVNARALQYAKKQSPALLVRQSIYTYKPDTRYDAIGAFDVMEHQLDDKKFLHSCKQLLKKDGFLFMTVPAGPCLWSRYDELSGHKRRYTISDIEALLSSCGLLRVYCAYWQVFSLPLYWLTRMVRHRMWQRIPIQPFHAMLYALGWLEVKLLRYISFPFGASLVVVCRKKEGV